MQRKKIGKLKSHKENFAKYEIALVILIAGI